MTSTPIDRADLRRFMRARRRELSPAHARSAMLAFARIAKRAQLLRSGMRVALYHAYGHEANVAALMELARDRGCRIYLPRIVDHRRHRMEFFRFDRHSVLRPNVFRILEPAPNGSGPVRIRDLDLIFVPLVAFDDHGRRLGSGAGFYDRRLHHLHDGRHWRRPRLIGVAYDFQRVARLLSQRWDIPLDAVITERDVQFVTRGASHNRGTFA